MFLLLTQNFLLRTHCLTEKESTGIISVRNKGEESEEVKSESCRQCVCEALAEGIQ